MKKESEIKVARSSGGQLSWVDSMPEEKGSRVAREFLFGILRGLCTQSYKHWLWKNDDYYPLAYPERYLYSHVATAIGSLTAIHLSEHGIQRKSRAKGTSSGRVDFWAHYKKTNFLIELKRVPFGLKTEKWPNKLESATNDAFKQAKSLKNEAAEDWGGAAMTGLCIALPYSGAKDKKNLNADETNAQAATFLKKASVAMKNSGGGPNFAGIWSPPLKARIFETSRGTWECIPFVGFLGRVDFSGSAT